MGAGTVGRHAVRAVMEQPELDLVGAYVYSAEKNGRDLGDICGIGATGGRILATLLREVERRDARYGIETMCIGGGQGLTAVFERA